MTTDAAPEATEETPSDPFADAQCDECGAAVKRRRPSLTGKHFCRKKNCQRAKSRFYHRRLATQEAESEARAAEQHQLMLVAFVGAAVHVPRVDCETCGRPGVIPRYAHPVPDWTAPCNPPDRLGISGDPALTTALMLAIYPKEA